MPSHPTEEDLSRLERAVAAWRATSPFRDQTCEDVAALVAEVRRLRRLETWIERFVAFEPAAEVPSQNDVALAIRIERMAVLRELRLLLEKGGSTDG